MLIVVAALLAIAAVPLAGGRLSALGEIRLVGVWLLVLALLLQVLVISVVPQWPRPLLAAVHIATYVLAGAFVWRNRRVPGVAVIAVGGALNGITIVLNGGVLPASPSALRRAGIAHSPAEFINAGVLAHPKLPWLGDVFAVPASWPLANAFSLGDVLILLGVAWGAHRSCGSVVARWPRQRLGASA
ncbi:MAG: DUF5317 domain-containing protein [Mycobacteriales bacterium]